SCGKASKQLLVEGSLRKSDDIRVLMQRAMEIIPVRKSTFATGALWLLVTCLLLLLAANTGDAAPFYYGGNRGYGGYGGGGYNNPGYGGGFGGYRQPHQQFQRQESFENSKTSLNGGLAGKFELGGGLNFNHDAVRGATNFAQGIFGRRR
ncbi:unnamed protein product, partial [Notodromas monacha]